MILLIKRPSSPPKHEVTAYIADVDHASVDVDHASVDVDHASADVDHASADIDHSSVEMASVPPMKRGAKRRYHQEDRS